MTQHAGDQPRSNRLLARLRATIAIAVMAVSAALLAEAGRQAEAQDAQATYARTAGPGAPSAVAGG